jgi:hypothetical protein
MLKISLLLFCLLFFHVGFFAQKWILRLKPSYGLSVLNFQENATFTYDDQFNNTGFELKNPGISDRAKWGIVDRNFGPNLEFTLDFYETPKWIFGIGRGIYSGGGIQLLLQGNQANVNDFTIFPDNIIGAGYGIVNQSLLQIPPQESIYASFYTDQFIGTMNFAYASRKLNITMNQWNAKHYLMFGAGYIKSNKDISTGKVGIITEQSNNNYSRDTYYKHSFMPYLLLRFETSFLTRKKNKVICNVALTYFQGFFKSTVLNYYDAYSISSIQTASIGTRNSSLALSLNKPITIISPIKKSKL